MSETSMKKQALLVGINKYEILPELKYAREDAEAVEQSLKNNYCFSDDEVSLLSDSRSGVYKPTNRIRILSHLDNLANQNLDLFIFGFWGHGVVRNGKRYLCPLDVSPDDVELLGIPFDDLINKLTKIRAKNACLILDCCQRVHDGERGEEETLTAADQEVIENAARDIVLKRKETEPEFVSNVAILNSCKQGQAAYEWDNRKHGIFTAHLLDAMSRRYDSVAQIVGYVSSNVEKTARELNKQQTPLFSLEGDIPLPVDTKTTPLITGDVFISYRHCNADVVAPIEEEFKKRGISYFIDRVGVDYTMEYAEALALAVKACKVLLFVWTQDADVSSDILREVSMALALKKRVLPYKIGTFSVTEHGSLFYQLSPISRYEVPRQTPETVVELVNQVERLFNPLFVPLSKPESFPPLSPKKDQSDPLTAFIEEEKRKKQTQIQNLLNEALESYRKGEYCKAISTLEIVLKLESNSEKAKELKSLCQSRLDFQKAEELRKSIAAKETTKAGERRTEIVNGVEFAFRWCPAGEFMMGSPKTEKGRRSNETQHQVTLTKGFWMMETEVTLGMFKAFVDDTGYESKGNTPYGKSAIWKQNSKYSWRNPGFRQDDNHPVTCVSWNDAVEFCNWLSKKTGQNITLPTEAQWEYSCRAGTTGAYAGNLDEMAWYKGSSGTHPVGTKKPNAWGLYDMHGNVWEWCADWYDKKYPIGSVTDPTGPSEGSYRVIRGGGWSFCGGICRSALRLYYIPEFRGYGLGFRCVKEQ